MKKYKKGLICLLLCLTATFAVGTLSACGKVNTNNPNENEQVEDNEQSGEENEGNEDGNEENENPAQKHTVTFDSNGGSLVQSQQIEKDGKAEKPTNPTKEDYVFLGWYVGGTKWNFANAVTGDMTLKASWAKAVCTLTVESDNLAGGTVSGSGEFNYGDSTTIEANTNMGYTFLGWYKGGEKVSNGTRLTVRVKDDTTYTAKWIECPITLERSDEKSGTVYGLGKTVVGMETTIEAVTNKGYVFLGWYNGGNRLTGEEKYTFTMTETPATYTARWDKNTCSLTTKSDLSIAGTYSLYNETDMTVGESVTLTVTPNAKYTFLGWYDGEELVSSKTSYTFTMPAENLVYTAKWIDGWKEEEGYNYWAFSQLGNEVMPIVGFNTPNASSADLGRTEGLDSQISLESYQMMKDCGFNVACGWWNDWTSYRLQDDILTELDYADQVGMVYIVNDRNALKTTQASGFSAYEQYMSKPAYGGTIIIDEPGAVNFADIANATRAWENSKYSHTLAYVNNLPKYAQKWQLEDCQGTGGSYEGSFNTYEEWLQLYLRTIQPQVFSYDFYPYVFNTDAWFSNLSNVRYYTMKANVPYWVYGQVGVWAQTGVDLNKELTYGQTAFQYNTMLAYGAKGVQYYNYFTPPNYGDVDGNTACVNLNGEKTVYYDYVQKINRQISAVDHVLMMSKWQGIIPINNSQYPLSDGDFVSSYGALRSATGAGDAIVGCFEYRDIGYAYYIASNNVSYGATITLNFDDSYNVTKIQDAVETQSSGNSITVALSAGEGALVVVPKK